MSCDPTLNSNATASDADSSVSDAETPPFVERRSKQAQRRRTTLLSFLRGGLIPRRRAGRRTGDHDSPIDWHDPYLLFLSLAILLLSVTDAFLTVTLLADGAIEANPLLALILNKHPQLFAAVKMALTGLSVVVLVAVARTRLFGMISARVLFQGLVLAYGALIAYELWLVSLMP
jgi:hypothetical protein